ncbi:MlaD family protein [Conexibacter arvalis]|uniref:Phospholipid/cholesterol/gamma-HCH transport system substrate-binding protein n=1 Tax=Conexibacter arvalis TaxID=912552 RepID=A0A840ICX3_9ACTN|nr:MlaD family protein [Conexibacter arvalis]MBB4662676.1 phospholipid/cholesterol/gamma-HCH transport system substrate-binding protein [Conexibacter arvalis]
MKLAIRKHLRDFIAILALVVVAAIVGGYILAHQRIYFPGWVPIVGRDDFVIKGEFETAQAITPGQGQTVDIAGVQVGEISNVELANGRALVTMRISDRYKEIYPNATMLLRPKTGLKDMVVELDPGSREDGRGPVEEGYTIPVSQTLPDVNLDELLAVLDRDTRAYLQLLLNGAAIGLEGNGEELAQAFRMFDPLARDGKRASELLIERRRHIRRAITNFGKFTQALGRNNRELTRFVDASQAALRRFADQGANIEQTLAALPGTLQQTKSALEAAGEFAGEAGPALEALRPFARNLGPALRATRPFLTETTPIVRDQIRPFTREATPVITTLRPAARQLAAATPQLTTGFAIFNRFFNALAYRPNSGTTESYLFYLTWLGHLANSATSTQDAMGAMLRANLYVTCSAGVAVAGVKGGDIPEAAALTLAAQLSNFPDNSTMCPKPPEIP